MAWRGVGLWLVACGGACAQSLVDAEHLAAARKAFDSASTAAPLRCSVNSVAPSLNFSFRFQTGYVVDVPLTQFRGTGHQFNVLVRATPEGRESSYLTATSPLPDVPETKVAGEVSGTFVVGDGVYSLEALVEDDLHRVCLAKWRIQTKRSGSERDLKPATPPGAVEELQANIPAATRSPSDARIGRLTVLLHAASLSPNAPKLPADDVSRLMASLSSLMAQLPARSVRLVVFNLDQQAVLFRKDDFGTADLAQVNEAINQLQLALVDYRTLQQGNKPADLLAGLVQAELRAPRPADAVIVMGPWARERANSAPAALEPIQGPPPPLFYLQHRRWQRPPIWDSLGAPGGRGGRGFGAGRFPGPRDGSNGIGTLPLAFPDPIERLTSRLKGETLAVRSPHDFADAIRRMAGRIRTTPAEAGPSLPGSARVEPPPKHADPGAVARVASAPVSAPGAPPSISTPPVETQTEASASDADPTDVLIRLRDQVLQHGDRIPNHTCVETVRRDRYEPVAGRMAKSCDAILAARKVFDFASHLRLETTDRLRLDVALTADREIYSWAGASRFEEGEIDELIPEGAMGTGPFAALLLSVFQNRDSQFVFEGDTSIAGRGLMEFSFKVPQDESHFSVKAHTEWVVTGYTGTLLVDPRTAELVRMTVRTEELPADTGMCETDTTLEYGLVALGGGDYLLPKAARQRFIGRDGAEGENSVTFASCREYRGESELTWGDKTPASGAPAPGALGDKTPAPGALGDKTPAPGALGDSATAPLRLPAGLPFTVELTTPIRGEAAAGDRIEGRLVKPIAAPRSAPLAPAGAVVEGRLMRVETRHPHPQVTIALRWETIELKGVKTRLPALPNRRAADLQQPAGSGGLRQRGVPIELPLPSEGGYGVYHFAGGSGSPGNSVIVDSGFRTAWITAEP